VTSRTRTLARSAAVLLALTALAALTACTSGTAATKDTSVAASSTTLRAAAGKFGLKVGVAVNTDRLDDPAYAQLTGDEFSTVTPENAMKWGLVEPTEGTYDWTAADKLVAFAQAHGQLVRGHNLVWYQQLPTWLTDAAPKMSAAQLSAILKAHITAEVTHFKGEIWQWDVVNEAFDDNGELRNDIWLEKLGPGYIADAFRWAHEADPAAKLFLNDYGIEDAGIKASAEYAFVQDLKSQGVPIDGVGFETHLDATYAAPDLETQLAKFAGLGLDVAVTEADVRDQLPVSKADVATQSDIFAQTMQACVDVPQCISYTVWDLDDKDSWIPQTFSGEGAATLYDDSLKPKPQFTAVQKVLVKAEKSAPQRSK